MRFMSETSHKTFYLLYLHNILGCTCIVAWSFLFKELVKPTLKDLMRELKVKAADWEDIGVELEVDDGTLKQIKTDNPGDSKSCLRELLRKWLSCVDPQPSWASIVEAIEGIGDEGLATEIKEKYCC